VKKLKLSIEDQIRILEEFKINYISNSCLKYGLNHSNYHDWIEKNRKCEKLSLAPIKHCKSNECIKLINENEKLREIIKEKDSVILRLLTFNPKFSF